MGMVVMLPSRMETVLEPVKPPGTPVEMPVGGPVVGVGAEMACEKWVLSEASVDDSAALVAT